MSAMAGQTVGPKWLTFFWEPMGTPGRAKKNGIYFFKIGHLVFSNSIF